MFVEGAPHRREERTEHIRFGLLNEIDDNLFLMFLEKCLMVGKANSISLSF